MSPAVTGQRPVIYAFGPFRLDPDQGLLVRDGRPVPITPKAFETLLALVEQPGRIVRKPDLIRRVWPDSFVEENNLFQNLSALRKALGLAPDGCPYIETLPKRGVRFRVPVTVLEDEAVVVDEVSPAPAAPAAFRPPQTRYARSGDVNIAYQVLGDGPLDLVFVMGWVSHLEYFWKEPRFARFLSRLASFSRLILFDKRGTGLSDRVPLHQLPTLEQRMDDVRAVLDAVGSRRAALCGVSEGGPMCGLFAATYPEKTAALVMIGTYAKRLWEADYPWAPTREQRQRFLDVVAQDWGGPVGLEERAPSLADDPSFREWWATYLRMGASPGAAVAFTRMNSEIDLRPVLPAIRTPTLVLHRTGDLCLKVEEGRYVAQGIPGARFVELPGADHLPFVGDQDGLLDEIEAFLTGVRPAPAGDGMLATVLHVRVLAPSRAVTGPSWSEGVAEHLDHLRREVTLFRGRPVRGPAPWSVAVFDGPARAIRCAGAVRDFARHLGLEVQVGLHTGECDVVAEPIHGPTVDVGRQVAEQAQPGQVLVTRTVRDLVAGSGLAFAEIGGGVPAGASGEWPLFEVT